MIALACFFIPGQSPYMAYSFKVGVYGTLGQCDFL
jgi:hypothetical protein